MAQPTWMEAIMNRRIFTIRHVNKTEHGYEYSAFQVVGSMKGKRVRKQFRTRDEALGEVNRLEVAAANVGGSIQALPTRLSEKQLAEAETAFARLGAQSLAGAV